MALHFQRSFASSPCPRSRLAIRDSGRIVACPASAAPPGSYAYPRPALSSFLRQTDEACALCIHDAICVRGCGSRKAIRGRMAASCRVAMATPPWRCTWPSLTHSVHTDTHNRHRIRVAMQNNHGRGSAGSLGLQAVPGGCQGRQGHKGQGRASLLLPHPNTTATSRGRGHNSNSRRRRVSWRRKAEVPRA